MKQNNKLEDIKLDGLDNDDLRSGMLEMNEEQLSKIANMSYRYFISKSVHMIRTLEDEEVLHQIDEQKEKEIILKNFDYIIHLFERLNQEESKIDVEPEMNILLDIRKECHDLSEVLYGYEIELSYIKELLDHHTIKIAEDEEYKHAHIDKREIHLLISRIEDILSSNTIDDFKYMDIVSNILGILPFRMSRSKYFDILGTTMIRNLNIYPADIVENQIEEYKKIFDSSLHGNYGIIFDNYFTDIQRFKNIFIEDLSPEELENMTRDIIDLSTDIRNIRNVIIDIGVLINRLIVVLLNRDKIILDCRDEVLMVFKNVGDGMDEKLAYSLVERSEKEFHNMEMKLLKDVEELKLLNDEILKRENFFNESLNENMLFTKDVLTYYNDTEFMKHEILFPQMEERISADHLEQLIDSLIYYIDRSMKNMGGMERKIRMRRLLSVLELPFDNMEQFLSYAEYSLDERLVSKGEILFTIDTLNHWLDEMQKEL